MASRELATKTLVGVDSVTYDHEAEGLSVGALGMSFSGDFGVGGVCAITHDGLAMKYWDWSSSAYRSIVIPTAVHVTIDVPYAVNGASSDAPVVGVDLTMYASPRKD